MNNKRKDYLKQALNIKGKMLDCCTSSNYDEQINEFFLKNIFKKKDFTNLISKYPSKSYEDVNKALADIFGKAKYIFGNGSEEIIVRINTYAKLNKLKVAVLEPLFYRIQDTLDTYQKICYQDLFESDLSSVDLCWIVNPNPLTPNYLNKQEIIGLVKNNPNVNFVIDETSVFFLDDWRKLSLFYEVNKHPNLTTISSLSKYFGVPGLRFGFCATNPDLFKKIGLVSATFPVSSIVASYATAILKNVNFFDLYRRKIKKNKQKIIKTLQQNHNFEFEDWGLNFILCKSKSPNFNQDLINNNIFSYDMKEVDNFYHNWVRLTVHSSDKLNTKVIKRLSKLVKPTP